MITPLLFASIRVPFMPKIIASDASEEAQGVVAADIAHDTCVGITSYMSRPDIMIESQQDSEERVHFVSQLLSSTVASSNWRTIVSHPWQQQGEHINVLEVRAALTAVRWSLSLPSSIQSSGEQWCGRRLLLVSDSAASLGSINKGRSSSHSLLRPLRTIAALVLGSGIQLSVVWIPSADNPADGPSRLHGKASKVRYKL
jgi:hypothetical protein